MWHHGFGRELIVRPPLSSLSYVLSTKEPWLSDTRVDRISTIDSGVERFLQTSRTRRKFVYLYKNIKGVEGTIFVKNERYSLQLATTSSSGDDDLDHNRAMSVGMREVKLRGYHVAKGMAIGQRCPEKLRKAITFKPELYFGKGFSHWEAISGRNASNK
jgi:hypothetical protein